MGNPFGPKREAGESPARSRHCDRGASPRDATGPTPDAVLASGEPGKVRGSATRSAAQSASASNRKSGDLPRGGSAALFAQREAVASGDTEPPAKRRGLVR